VFYKAQICSRKPGTRIKRCWNWACTLKRAGSSSYQWLYAWSTLGSTLKRTVSSYAQQLSGSSPFSPKIPNFDLPTPKYVSKDCLQVHELKRAFKNTSNMKSNVISTQFTNSTHFYKTLNNNSIHTTNPKLWTPKVWIINNNTS